MVKHNPTTYQRFSIIRCAHFTAALDQANGTFTVPGTYRQCRVTEAEIDWLPHCETTGQYMANQSSVVCAVGAVANKNC